MHKIQADQKLIVSVLISAFSSLNALADDAATAPVAPLAAPSAALLRLSQVEVGAISVMQSGGGKTYSAIVRWSPQYQLMSNILVGANIGLSEFKSNTDTRFLVMDTTLTGSCLLMSQFSVGGYAGLQNWMSGNGGSKISFGAQGRYSFAEKKLGIDSAFLEVGRVAQSLAATEISAGVRFSF